MVNASGIHHENGIWEVTWKFEDDSFETLKTIAEERTYKAGEMVFREGDPSDGMYLVTEGSALIIRRTRTGEERTVAIVAAGQSFGEIGLLVERPRQGTAAAGTFLRVLKITRVGLELMHKSAPDMAFLMYQALARTLAEQLLSTQEMQVPE
jgi:CRP/FNR family transcriptional regulator, cyclic AMP receptor protein